MRAEILHTTDTGLWTEQCLQLCVAKRSNILAVDVGTDSDDAGHGERDATVHFALHGMRSAH